jgi:hypothetical protein
MLAALMWGAGGSVRVRGNHHLRAACREAGLTVINNNLSAKAWRAITTRVAPRPRRRLGRSRPGRRLYRFKTVGRRVLEIKGRVSFDGHRERCRGNGTAPPAGHVDRKA